LNREELLKVAKPILFNVKMVQAILDNRKTVTRRVVKAEDIKFSNDIISANIKKSKGISHKHFYGHIKHFIENYSPYKVGDILYVRETWWKGYLLDANENIIESGLTLYKADAPNIPSWGTEEYSLYKWRPSIHMPKSAARIFLKVTNVRVERICNMLTIDFLNEGIELYKSDGRTEKSEIEIEYEFEDLWNSTIKKEDLDKYGWDANPFVWVIEVE